MVDRITKDQRSRIMSKIRSKDTQPEIIVRSLLHRMGYRFRLHRKDLPGKPDIVLPKYKTVIFVHGCFWHQHKGCKKASIPKSNTNFWQKKLSENHERDLKKQQELKKLGWKVIVIWECKTTDIKKLTDILMHKIP